MPSQHEIYYEHQSGGLCRKHAINGYFEYAKITTDIFNKYQQEYDKEYAERFNFQSSCSTFDIITSDQKNIVSYILKKHGIYTRYYALNQIFQKNIHEHIINTLAGDFFFIYNESHIYGVRRKNDKWYIVNSIGGVSATNINNITGQKNIGFIVPVNIKTEFYRNLKLVKELLGHNPELKHINEYLIKKHENKLILGQLEIPLGICMDILYTQYQICESNEFESIHNIVIKYNEFLSKFTKGRYNDIDLILQYLPDIIIRLTCLSIQKT
jgi:hypothetical protein